MKRQRQKRKESFTSSESLDDEEIILREKERLVEKKLEQQDQLNEIVQLPDLDQHNISSSSEDEDDAIEINDQDEIIEEEDLDETNNFDNSLVDNKILESLNKVSENEMYFQNCLNEFNLDKNDKQDLEKLRDFQKGFKSCVLFYLYLQKKQSSEKVEEHPVIKKISELIKQIPSFIQQSNK